MSKSSKKNKMVNNTREHLTATGTDSNTIFKWSDDLAQDLLKALSNFKTVMQFQNKGFNADKSRRYEKIRKEIVKINERFVECFGSVSLPLFLSDMDKTRKLDCLKSNKVFLSVNILNRMFDFTISE